MYYKYYTRQKFVANQWFLLNPIPLPYNLQPENLSISMLVLSLLSVLLSFICICTLYVDLKKSCIWDVLCIKIPHNHWSEFHQFDCLHQCHTILVTMIYNKPYLVQRLFWWSSECPIYSVLYPSTQNHIEPHEKFFWILI